MASPQIEDGFTPIANELLEQMVALNLPPNQWQILMYIIRKTYGFRQKTDYIANCQIVDATGLTKSTVSRGVRARENANIITRNGRYIGVQKDWERWQIVVKTDNKSCQSEQQKLANRTTAVVNLDNKSCQLGQQKLSKRATNPGAKDSEKLSIRQLQLSNRATKVASPVVTQKNKLIQKKDSSSCRDSLEIQIKKISEELRPNYPDIDFDHELKKFSAYWFGGKKKLKNPRLALLKWLHQARKFNQEGDSNGKHKNRAPIPGNEPAGAFADIDIWK